MISEPEVYERQLTDDDRVLVMGSDGLWEFIPSRDVIQLIEDCEQPDVRTEESVVMDVGSCGATVYYFVESLV